MHQHLKGIRRAIHVINIMINTSTLQWLYRWTIPSGTTFFWLKCFRHLISPFPIIKPHFNLFSRPLVGCIGDSLCWWNRGYKNVYVHTIPDIKCRHKNHTIGLLFSDTKGAFGVISVTEQSCTALISAWCWMWANKLFKSCCCSYHTRQLDNNLFWVWLSPTSIMKCM